MDLVDKPMKTIKTSIYRLEMIEMNLNLNEIYESYLSISIFTYPVDLREKAGTNFLLDKIIHRI